MTLGGLLLAAVCGALTFGWPVGNLWLKIGISAILVTAYSFAWQRPHIPFRGRSVFLGTLSALVLYGIFFLGNFMANHLVTSASVQVNRIYELASDTNGLVVFLLLLLVAGPGEEVFWRGFLQSKMMSRLGTTPGYVVATLTYAAVHLFSGNLVLVLAALIAGAFWGALYVWTRDLVLVMVSHSLWSAFVFTVFPIR